jgi:peptidoglycan/xylan/chitin deacetylase (PgdA/CDA1 family)
VKDNAELLKKIYDAGHEIASHGYSHKEHEKLSLEQNLTEMQKTHQLVADTIGYQMTLFAPPGGSYSKLTVQACDAMGYTCIMWTHDTIDWRDQDEDLIYSRATNAMAGGDLVLMHPKAATVAALPKIIDYATKHGFVVTTVSDTIA